MIGRKLPGATKPIDPFSPDVIVSFKQESSIVERNLAKPKSLR